MTPGTPPQASGAAGPAPNPQPRPVTDTPHPTWCREEYTADDGTRNCASAPFSVTGFDADNGDPIVVSVWVEHRENGTDIYTTGVLEKHTAADVELSSYQLRELAAHLSDVADLVVDPTASVPPSFVRRVRRPASTEGEPTS